MIIDGMDQQGTTLPRASVSRFFRYARENRKFLDATPS
jgi:hypothetical protein